MKTPIPMIILAFRRFEDEREANEYLRYQEQRDYGRTIFPLEGECQ
jgi:hypothetical protein